MPLEPLSSTLSHLTERFQPQRSDSDVCEPLSRGKAAPSGTRRVTPESVQQAQGAAGFQGLPEGVGSPRSLLLTLKKARAALGLSCRILDLLDRLFGDTHPQDWQGDSRPVVWPSNRILQHDLGLSPSGLKKVVRQAVELGLLTVKESPNGNRYGRRDGAKKIVLARTYGFDLSPLAIRYAEFRALGLQDREAYRAREAARRRAYIAKAAILSCLEAAEAQGLWAGFWEELEGRAGGLFGQIAPAESLADLLTLASRLEGMRAEAEEVLAKAVRSVPEAVESNPYGAQKCPLKTLQYSTDFISLVQGASEDCSSADGASAVPPSEAKQSQRSDLRAAVETVTPAELVQLAPQLLSYARSTYPNWTDLGEAATWLRGEWGISGYLWDRAFYALGGPGRVIALAILTSRPKDHYTSAGGYFCRMIDKAEKGELNLMKSVFGLRSQAIRARMN